MHYYIVILEIWRQIGGPERYENIPYRAETPNSAFQYAVDRSGYSKRATHIAR